MTLTIQERQHNRDLYEYVSHIRCERCPMVLVEDDPKEWEADRQAKGVCSKCRSRKHYAVKNEEDAWPSVKTMDYVERDFTHPLQYA